MADLTALVAHVRENARRAMERTRVGVVEDIRRMEPSRSSHLQDTTDATAVSDNGDTLSMEVFADAPYAVFLDRGTVPHVIRPIGQGYPLTFYWPTPNGPGSVVHFMEVHHPGNRAYEFFAKPMPDRFRSILQESLDYQT